MKIGFFGGAQTVTGSSFIVQDKDYNIMIDCGMFQGRRAIRERNYTHQNYNPEDIDVLLLTHAHIDHSGLIPKLVKNGFKGKIFSTKSTADLCSIMLPDSAHIQEMDAAFINKKNKKLGRHPIEPLYSIDDAARSLDNFIPVSYGDTVQVHPKVKVRFRDAGHILGSSIIEMWIDDGSNRLKIVFSGDLGPRGQAIIRDPEVIEEADILLIESTYGNRIHKNKEDTYNEFKEIILNSYNKKGNIIIPAFAIERTQEIIYTLAKLFKEGEIPKIPVYIDSPLAISATEIFRKNKQCFDSETREILLAGNSPLDFSNLYFSRSTEESKKLNTDAAGTIIISASGMCTAGRIKHHLQHNLYKPESSIIFVGYQAEGTLGRRLIQGAKQVRVYGKDVAVKAKLHTLGGFSAHADRDGLLEWTRSIKNSELRVFIVHGEKESSQSFADTLRTELGLTSYVPEYGEVVDLGTMSSQTVPFKIAGPFTEADSEIEALSGTLKALIDRYNRTKAEKKLNEIRQLEEDISDIREMMAMIIDDL